VARKQGHREARRVPPALLTGDAEEFLEGQYGKGTESRGGPVLSTEGEVIYLNRAWLRGHNLKSSEVEQALADWLKKQEGIAAAYTRTQLLRGVAKDDAIGQAVRRSFHPERSGDVFPVLKPYCLLTSALATGTTHGTPHDYDTHVPLMVYGPGVKAGVRKDRVTPLAAAPVLAHALGIRPPAAAEAPVPRGLFAD
jgi:hypothetical protein